MEEKNYIILNKKVRVNYKSIFMCMTRLKYLNMLGTCKFGQCWTCGDGGITAQKVKEDMYEGFDI